MTPLIREMVAMIGEDASESMWFDITGCEQSEIRSQEAMKFTPMPFENCSVVFKNGDEDVLLTLMEKGASLSMTMHVIKEQAYKTIQPAIVMWHEGQRKILPKDAFQTQASEDEFRHMRAATGWFLSLLDQPRDAYKPTAKVNSPTNKRRMTKGKPPLVYDWHTVKIEPPAPSNESQGGTHASPRRHQCRGHWRNCKSGKRVWVKDCWKGDASKGTVFKDYKIGEVVAERGAG